MLENSLGHAELRRVPSGIIATVEERGEVVVADVYQHSVMLLGDYQRNRGQYGDRANGVYYAPLGSGGIAAEWLLRDSMVELFHHGDPAAVVSAVDRSLAVDPTNVSAWLFRALLASLMHKWADCAEFAGTGMLLGAPNYGALGLRARCKKLAGS